MNAHVALSAYHPVGPEWSYTMTADDFPDGCAIKTDAISGRSWAFGRNKLGLLISAPLGVQLCRGCDRPIVAGICPDCCVAFVGEIA